MSWTVRLNSRSQKSLNRLDLKQRRRIARAIDEMRDDPFAGDVKPLKDKKWSGFFRKRVGRYRIIFFAHHDQNHIDLRAIVLRNEKTYQ